MSGQNKKKNIKRVPAPPSATVKKTTPTQKKNSWLDLVLKPQIVFSIFAFIFGTLFIFSTPPFQVADEIAHFDRTFKLAELGTFQKVENNFSGDYVPKSIDSTLKLFRYLSWRPDQKVRSRQITQALTIPLKADERAFVNIDAGVYFYFSYIPQLPAMLIGKILNFNVLYILYLGKLFALLFFIFCVSHAIKIIPVGKYLMLSIALMPMCLAQAGSYNADCVSFSLLFLFIALIVERSYNWQGFLYTKETFILLSILLILGILKFIYLPFLLLLFFIPALFRIKKNLSIIVVISTFLLSIVFAFSWLKLSGVTDISGTSASNKTDLLINNPLMLADIISQTVSTFHEMYYKSAIGILGYLDTVLPKSVYSIFTFLIIFLTLFEVDKTFRLSLFQRLLLIFTSSSVFVLTILTLYLTTKEDTGLVAQGVQGRYFIPAIFPFFLAFCGLIPFKINFSNKKVLAFLVYLLLFIALYQTQATLIKRYFG